MRIFYGKNIKNTSLMFVTPDRTYFTNISVGTIIRIKTLTTCEFTEYQYRGNPNYLRQRSEIKNLKKFLIRVRIITWNFITVLAD